MKDLDPSWVSALRETHALDFELYDTALDLAAEQMVAFGVRSSPPARAASFAASGAAEARTLALKALDEQLGSESKSEGAECQRIETGWQANTDAKVWQDDSEKTLGGASTWDT
jgi:hypothetical protein